MIKSALSQRALIARINRKLAHDREVLRKSRDDSRWITTSGEFYVVNIDRNAILRTHVDVHELGRELGVTD